MSEFHIINDNCFDFIPKMIESNFKVDLIVTDPPYYINDKVVKRRSKKEIKNHYESEMNKSMIELSDLNIDMSYDIEKFSQLVVLLQNHINAYFFCNKKQIPLYFDIYVNKLKCNFELISWHKTNALPTYFNKYLSDTEYILYFHKQSGKLKPQSYEDAKTYYLDAINVQDKKKYNHPTIKPLNLVEKLIRNSSLEGDLVFDPFLGSGTTGVAALKNNRNFLGIEVVKQYYDLSVNRCSEI